MDTQTYQKQAAQLKKRLDAIVKDLEDLSKEYKKVSRSLQTAHEKSVKSGEAEKIAALRKKLKT